MSNPVFNERVFENEKVLNAEPMTINGSINKTFILFALLLVASATVWSMFFKGYTDKVMMLLIAGTVAGISSFIVIMFDGVKSLPVTAPIYAVSEGLVLGGLSAITEASFPGIVIQAVGATFATLFSLLLLYRVGAIRCTERLRSVVFITTLAIMGIYFVNLIGSFFGMQIPQINTSSNIGIGFSIFVCVVASLNLIVDFDFIEKGAQKLLPKEYEWYGAFGLMVTLVWLYVEILNLLRKMRNR